jgi:hypothetical protein
VSVLGVPLERRPAKIFSAEILNDIDVRATVARTRRNVGLACRHVVATT